MRHRKSGRQLNRNSSHRKAMYRNMACSLFEHKVIKTTVPKAKELRRVVEPLITHAINNDSVAGRRHAFDRLRSNEAVDALFSEIAPASKDRNGGYVRILKCGFRTGDKAPMAFVEIIDRENALPAEPKAPKVKPTEKKAEKPATAPVAEVVGDEDPVEQALGEGFDADAAKAALGKNIKQDDLTMIEGIGPKIAEIFTAAGIDTWSKLGETDAEKLKEILAEAGDRYNMHDPGTWPRQAELAAKGQWAELAEWQDKLDGGKEVE